MNNNYNIYQKIDEICARLEGFRAFNPKLAKLSYSGGRDSHLLLHILRNVLKLNNEQFPAIYAKTYNEFAEIKHRIEEQDITVVDSGRRVFEVFEEVGVPLWSKDCSVNIYYASKNEKKYTKRWAKKSKSQWNFTDNYFWCKKNNIICSDKCCKLLKENILNKNKARVVGLREEEGGRRSEGQKEYDFCVRNSKVLFKPIFDVTNSELMEIEKALRIEPLNIYNYLDRTGCVMCGFGTKKQIAKKINYLRWYEPSRAAFYLKYFDKYLRYRKII
ncbi:MAG: hypothetical protein LBN27_02030 [Prevotellaceae bacterium]|jgi:3'-phosphoadenosine 5'-phosphosulfate sulfotransferase (PAPS reductase)/FAD synthetase|nr:hypothetical protein [Prevotellaceae bacterium]